MASSSAISLIITPAPGIVADCRTDSLSPYLYLSHTLSLSLFRSLSLTYSLALSSPSRSFTQIETIILPFGVSRGARGHPGDGCGRTDDRVSVTCSALLRHRRPYCPRGAAAAAPRVYTCAHAQTIPSRRNDAARPGTLVLFHMTRCR